MKNIVIADDERTFLLSLSEGLRFCDHSFRATTAENGLQALELLMSGPADLLITDIMMPIMDGISLLGIVLKKYPDLPVIVLTAHMGPEMEQKLRSLGVTAVFEKPVELNELVGAVTAILNSSAGSRKYGSKLSAISSAFKYLATRKDA